MARTVSARGRVPLDPSGALALWTDVERWPSFVEGFARVLERDSQWPEEGARVVWESGAGGRGRVTERVVEHRDDRFATEVFEERLSGTQRFAVTPDGGGTRAELSLEYELTSGAPLRAVADLLFIRRALRDALARTLRRYGVEAEDDAGLREQDPDAGRQAHSWPDSQPAKED